MPVEVAEHVEVDLARRSTAASPTATRWEILRWAVETFGPKLTMATAFGPEGCAILHMLAEVDPERQVRVFNLDTGYQFAETLELRDRIAERYGIEVELVRPDPTVERVRGGQRRPGLQPRAGPLLLRAEDRPPAPRGRRLRRLDLLDPGRPVGRPGEGRRSSAGTPKFDLVKVNPLLRWTRRDVWAFVVTNKVPYNPLHDRGYPSIGCWPCTRPVAEGEDERAGRWAGQAKTECGLHSLDSSQL